MPKVVFYLPFYDERIREEFKFPEKPTKEQLKEAKEKFIERFGYGRRLPNNRFFGGKGAYDDISLGGKAFGWPKKIINKIRKTKTIVKAYYRKTKPVITHVRGYRKWTKQQEGYIISHQKESIRSLAKRFKRSYEGVKSKKLRILGRKK